MYGQVKQSSWKKKKSKLTRVNRLKFFKARLILSNDEAFFNQKQKCGRKEIKVDSTDFPQKKKSDSR